MIKDVDYWERFKAKRMASEPPDPQRGLAMMDEMFEHARRLGALRTSDLSERLIVKIHMAKVLNGLRSA